MQSDQLIVVNRRSAPSCDRSGQNQLHDFVGAFVDLQDFGIPHEPFRLVFPKEALAPQELDGVGGGPKPLAGYAG